MNIERIRKPSPIYTRLFNLYLGNPKVLIITDAGGALISAFLLGVVLVRFQEMFGIPVPVLYILATIPCFFLLFDLYSLTKQNERIGQFLKIIGGFNLLYCVVSLVLVLSHSERIEILGWAYILSELVIVVGLAWIEFSVAKKIEA